jgi:hypothetical protein
MKTSARKSEMHIEECAIKQAIQRYWIDTKMPEIDGETEDSGITMDKISKGLGSSKTLYQLEGKY